MVHMNEENRLALLVGAGLSADANLPMSVELAHRLRERLLELSVSTEGTPQAIDARRQATNHLALYNFLNGGVRFQEGVLNRDPDAPVNVEQIAIAAEELQTRMTNPLAPYAAGWHRRIEEMEQESPGLLRTFVDFIYSGLEEWLELSDPTKVTYLRGLNELCIHDLGLDIFSLNYDLSIEIAFNAAGMEFSNGFGPNAVWSPTLFKEATKIRLHKLHGSLDWVDDEIYGLCSLQFPRHENAESIEGDSTRPLLIFGTAHKLSAREPFLTLAYHFSQRILRTKVLPIVGYSFGDGHVNQIIEQGLRRNQDLRIIVVSPMAEELVHRHRFLDKNPRVSTISKGAKIALNERLLSDRVRGILKDISTDPPFS